MLQHAINEYLFEYHIRTGTGEHGLFSPQYWVIIQNTCSVLVPFEEATKMVTYDKAVIRDTFPLVFLLKHTLHDLIDQSREAQQQVDLWLSQVLCLLLLALLTASIPMQQRRNMWRGRVWVLAVRNRWRLLLGKCFIPPKPQGLYMDRVRLLRTVFSSATLRT